MTLTATNRQLFLEQYRQVRYAEGRGSEDPEYYRALPFADLGGRNSAMWAMRAKTYKYFERKILTPLEKRAKHPLAIIDLGAGNGWMSYRLELRGHCSVALDIFSDPFDGLLAARHYPRSFPLVEAEFNALPFAPASFDLAVFNASIHYSADYASTLCEVRRILRPSGIVVILDSPIYRTPADGLLMVAERRNIFQAEYGFASDALSSIEYLDEHTLEMLSEALQLRWTRYRPWYGWRWHLRPWKARLQRRRAPSRFWILTGVFQDR
jgi:ubiquinone/menaquinone biosynthesis C-methylase UbiE